MKYFLMIPFFFIAVITSITVQAQTPTDKREAVVEQREQNQQNRIDQGVQSGQLNKREEGRLEAREKHIQNMEKNAMADGKMSKKEFRRIERAQNRTSRGIHRQKHDGQKRR